jgi:hypothetical protein
VRSGDLYDDRVFASGCEDYTHKTHGRSIAANVRLILFRRSLLAYIRHINTERACYNREFGDVSIVHLYINNGNHVQIAEGNEDE